MYNDGYPILTWEEERAQPTVQERFDSGVKKYTVKSTTLNKNIKLSSLKKGKNYIRVRAYKTYNGKTAYGNWSKIKSVKR